MLIPIRCFTCNKVLGHLAERFKCLVCNGHSEADALDILKVQRYCCRTVVLTHVDLIEKLNDYESDVKPNNEEIKT